MPQALPSAFCPSSPLPPVFQTPSKESNSFHPSHVPVSSTSKDPMGSSRISMQSKDNSGS
eukprot:CAMPEP_0202834236 /NCGR_PEP_ID=MMETSP1389-20130828/31228_1 /ASSEMBLY_ACC=CAM_ASM_000865 /TAXON_ID=302021 /ORGANISM="Rhodomonas sp., Strain CCMP768" /LENGTH=59 /DNA_ID=CAMNT_0049509347 /DNA_START=340 /DNA_END=516 /DNA_ORIENTATION=+